MRNTVFKRLLSIAAVLAMTSPIAVDAIEIDNIEYQFVDEQAMVLGYHPGTSTSFNLVIPDYVSYDGDDYPVRQIISG